MNNTIVTGCKPFLFLSKVFYRSIIKSQIVRNLPQKAFSERILCDVRTIENLHRRSKGNNVLNKHLYRCCSENSELLPYVIDVIHCASSRQSVSQALVYDVVNAFSNYIEDNGVKLSSTLNQNIDMLSSILNFKNYQLLQLVCNVFKIHENPMIYKEFIEELIRNQKGIEAAYLTSALHLQKEFDDEKILLPLLLEGQTHPALIYMKIDPDIQLRATKWLDKCLKNDVVPHSNVNPRKIFKTLSSLVTAFKIPLDNCPNLQIIRSKGAINILVHRRSQQSVTEETWEEMIKNIVKDNEDLKKYLIQKLKRRKDMKTALKMAEIFNVNDPELCLSRNDCESSTELEDNQQEDLESSCGTQENFDIYDISEEYLKFNLKAEDIKIVNNKEDFVNSINEIQNYNMIGMDSEWKPQFGLSREKLSLIQLAVHDKVYIFDVLILSESLESADWDTFLDDIFGNPNIVILGCGIMSDVHMILDSIKGTKGKTVKFSHMLDMALFYQKLQDVYPVEMNDRSDKACTKGLSTLCEIILGKPLNKEDRLCDWEKRPLMERQLEYAALDAHCLLQMYTKLRETAVEKSMNFDHLAKVAIVLTTSQWKAKKKYKGIKFDKAFHVHNTVRIEHLKILMDSYFEVQGKELRKLGADVIILKQCDSADKVIEISEREGRIVVCTEKLYPQIKTRLKEGFCYLFPSKTDTRVTHFLQCFNLQVSTKSMSSRCINCNSVNGIKLSLEDLNVLQDLQKSNQSINFLLKENATSCSIELQMALNEILKSDIVIDFSPVGSSSFINEYSFLCKACGHVS